MTNSLIHCQMKTVVSQQSKTTNTNNKLYYTSVLIGSLCYKVSSRLFIAAQVIPWHDKHCPINWCDVSMTDLMVTSAKSLR